MSPETDPGNTERADQRAFDDQVDRAARRWLPIAAGVGIGAALMMSLVALAISTDHHTTTMMQAAPAPAATAPAKSSAPATASIMIDHVTKGCHTLAINGGAPGSPSATLHMAAGGVLHLQNNDVMPHKLVRVTGPQPQMSQATMSHMGAKTNVTFPTSGTYRLTTKAGEDYMKGVATTGADNVLKIKVIVS
jgi:plastocyanin